MVKKLVCDHGDEGSIPSNDNLNLVINDYNMTTWFVNGCNMIKCVLNDYKMITYLFIHVNITHSCFGHKLTHVMLSCLSKLFGTTLVTILV